MARYRIEGGAGLRRRGDGVDVMDDRGRARIAIRAPEAIDARGTSWPVELGIEGDTLVLSVAAKGELLGVTAAWSAGGANPILRDDHELPAEVGRRRERCNTNPRDQRWDRRQTKQDDSTWSRKTVLDRELSEVLVHRQQRHRTPSRQGEHVPVFGGGPLLRHPVDLMTDGPESLDRQRRDVLVGEEAHAQAESGKTRWSLSDSAA